MLDTLVTKYHYEGNKAPQRALILNKTQTARLTVREEARGFRPEGDQLVKLEYQHDASDIRCGWRNSFLVTGGKR